MKNINKGVLYTIIMVMIYACGSDDAENPIVIPDDDVVVDIPDSCSIVYHGKASENDLISSEELVLLEGVYVDFENHIKDNNETALRSILLDNSMPLFITGKEVSGIKKIRLSGSQFLNNVVSSPTLELRITDANFERVKGAAISWANYSEVFGGNTTATGVDLFFYINTASGWKLATTNNTYVLSGDNTDYESKNPMTTLPKDALDKMVTAFNAKNKVDLLNTFQSNSVFISLSSLLSEEYSSGTHTSTAFINCVVEDERQYELTLSNEEIEIRDQYLAKVIADYKITLEGNDLEIGKLILTMIATPSDGWIISSGALTY